MTTDKFFILLNYFKQKIKKMPYFGFLILFHDGVMAFFSLFTSLYLKISDEFLNYSPEFLLKNLIAFVFITVGVFTITNTHKVIWKFVSVEDLSALAVNIVICNIVYLLPMFLLSGDESFSFGVPWINIFVMLVFLMLPRFLVRFIHDQSLVRIKKKNSGLSIPVLLVGDETPTELLIAEIQSCADLPYEPIGILTCKEHVEEGQTIHGIPILGSVDDLESVLLSLEKDKKIPRQIIITDPQFSKTEKKQFIKKAEAKELVVLQMIQHLSLNVVPSED
jgi:FlaA1/EpsC-like NDP-sugar epimerase